MASRSRGHQPQRPDSTPDWEPYEQPKAPNVLFIVWDDTGFGAWEPFGGPIKVPHQIA